MRKNYICINPYHYCKQYNKADFSYHKCSDYLCVHASSTGLKTVCNKCKKVVVENVSSNNFFTIDESMTITEEDTDTKIRKKKSKVVQSLEEVDVKEEPIDEDEEDLSLAADTLANDSPISDNDKNIEELDKDFEGMLESIEDAVVKEEIQEACAGEEPSQSEDSQEEDMPSNVEISAKKRPAPITTEPPSKRTRVTKNPKEKPFHCWQCLAWFKTKFDLGKHSCLQELNMTSELSYTCHFC